MQGQWPKEQLPGPQEQLVGPQEQLGQGLHLAQHPLLQAAYHTLHGVLDVLLPPHRR